MNVNKLRNDEFLTQKGRLLEFALKQNYTKESFVKLIGVAYNYFDQEARCNVSTHILDKVKRKFPFLNTRWIKDGKGGMYNINYQPEQIGVTYDNEDKVIANSNISNNISESDLPEYNSPIKGRIIEFIIYKGISRAEFCKSIGAAMSYINNLKKTIRLNKREKIHEVYPELNMFWLMTGKGKMLNENEVPEVHPCEDTEQDSDDNNDLKNVNDRKEETEEYLWKKIMSNKYEDVSDKMYDLSKWLSMRHGIKLTDMISIVCFAVGMSASWRLAHGEK